MASLVFDATTVAPQEPRTSEPLPAGIYTVEITSSEVKPLKSGNGMGLSLEFTVIDPEPYAKRKVWQQLNIQHANAQAEQIGQAQLSALCHAIGVLKLKDDSELFGRVLRVRTKVRPAQGEYGPRAEVTGYEQAGAALPSAPQPTPAASAAKPWQRKAA